MGNGLLSDGPSRVLRQSLSGLVRRQQLIANNLANMDTPGYRSLDIPFEQVLDRQLSREGGAALLTTSPAHIRSESALLVASSRQQANVYRSDGNGVDVDVEMSRLAETAISFNAVSQLMARRLAILRSAVTEGRR